MMEKVCTRCLVTLPVSHFGRDGKRYRSDCKSCHAASKKLYRQLNSDSVKESAKRSRLKHKAKIAERYKEWRLKNAERVKVKLAEWVTTNKDRVSNYKKEWRLRNPVDQSKARLYRQRYAARHGERYLLMVRQYSANRRSRKRRSSIESITPEMIACLLLKQKRRCVYCQMKLGKKYHCDHIVPLALGGPHSIMNLQITCPSCNVRKSAKDPIKFANSIGLLL